MSDQREIPENTRPALYVGAMILALVGAILNFFFEFAWWYESSYYGYNFGLGTSFTPWLSQLLIVILGLMFLYVLLVALQQLYPILKVSKEVDKRIEQSGFFVSIGTIALSIIITILFYIFLGRQVETLWDDGLGTGFYAGVIAGFLCAVLFFLASKIDQQKT